MHYICICAGRRGGGTGQPGRHHIGQLQLEGKHQGNLRESAWLRSSLNKITGGSCNMPPIDPLSFAQASLSKFHGNIIAWVI